MCCPEELSLGVGQSTGLSAGLGAGRRTGLSAGLRDGRSTGLVMIGLFPKFPLRDPPSNSDDVGSPPPVSQFPLSSDRKLQLLD